MYVSRGEVHVGGEAGGGGFVQGVVAQAADKGGRPRDGLGLGLDRLSDGGHQFFGRLMRILNFRFVFSSHRSLRFMSTSGWEVEMRTDLGHPSEVLYPKSPTS